MSCRILHCVATPHTGHGAPAPIHPAHLQHHPRARAPATGNRPLFRGRFRGCWTPAPCIYAKYKAIIYLNSPIIILEPASCHSLIPIPYTTAVLKYTQIQFIYIIHMYSRLRAASPSGLAKAAQSKLLLPILERSNEFIRPPQEQTRAS